MNPLNQSEYRHRFLLPLNFCHLYHIITNSCEQYKFSFFLYWYLQVFFFLESFNLWRLLLIIALYHQTKTPISFYCRRGLNSRSLIQPLETLPVKLTGTHHWYLQVSFYFLLIYLFILLLNKLVSTNYTR